MPRRIRDVPPTGGAAGRDGWGETCHKRLKDRRASPIRVVRCLGVRWGGESGSAPASSPEVAQQADAAKFSRFHRGMLERGVYLAPSPFEAAFTSMAHTDADIEATIKAAKEVFAEI